MLPIYFEDEFGDFFFPKPTTESSSRHAKHELAAALCFQTKQI